MSKASCPKFDHVFCLLATQSEAPRQRSRRVLSLKEIPSYNLDDTSGRIRDYLLVSESAVSYRKFALHNGRCGSRGKKDAVCSSGDLPKACLEARAKG
jgi:hypothetical protein